MFSLQKEATADELKSQTGGERVEVVLAEAGDSEAALGVLRAVAVGDVQVDDRSLTAAVSGGAASLGQVLTGLEAQSITVLDIGLRRPTLDDVFLTLTGHAPAGDEKDGADRAGSEAKEDA